MKAASTDTTTKLRANGWWFFMWKKGGQRKASYLTPICSSQRYSLISAAERELGMAWEYIYRDGGRAVKCNVRQA